MPDVPEMAELPDLPSRELLAAHLGKMLLARGAGLPGHGEPWHLVQVTEPAETGTFNEEAIMTFEVLFLPPARREDGTYVFTDEENAMVGAMFCETWISPTGAACMRSTFSSIPAQAAEIGSEDED